MEKKPYVHCAGDRPYNGKISLLFTGIIISTRCLIELFLSLGIPLSLVALFLKKKKSPVGLELS